MATQRRCLLSKNRLRGREFWCFTCTGYMHVKCSHLDGSSDPYDNFSSHRCTSQFYSPNGTYESHRPTLATSTLTELHPLAYTAPLPKKFKRTFHYRTCNNTRLMVKPQSRFHRIHKEIIQPSGPLETCHQAASTGNLPSSNSHPNTDLN